MTNNHNQHPGPAQDEYLQQAINHHQVGRLPEAERLYRAILQAEPHHPDANHNLGILALQAKQPAAALPHLMAALEANPNQSQYWISCIDALLQAGMMDAARVMLAQGRQRGLEGNAVDVLMQRLEGPLPDEISRIAALLEQERYAEAEALACGLTERFPQDGLGWKALGVALKRQGRISEAHGPVQKAAELSPWDAEAQNNFGNTLKEQGRLAEAEAIYRRAVTIKPDYAEAYYNLGVILQEQDRIDEAEAIYRQALAFKPDYAEACNNLGISLQGQERFPEAEAAYRRALEIRPDYADAYVNLGTTLEEQCRLAEAEITLRQALGIKPDLPEAYNDLANILKDQCRHTEAEQAFRRAMEIRPAYPTAHSNILFIMRYVDRYSPSEYLKEACDYGRMVSAMARSVFSSWSCEPRPERLRVGLVSGDLHTHPVGFFLDEMIRHIDPARMELIAYPTCHREDETSAALKSRMAGWKSLSHESDEAAAGEIHADGVHILLDLSGHTAKNRLALFAWRPAPIQATWLGYWATTGVAEMDYFLADEIGVPKKNRRNFTEKVIYLPDTRLCFSPPKEDVAVAPLPALTNGYVTFGCFQNLSKVSDAVLEAWGRILARLPGSRLRIQSRQLADPPFVERFHMRMDVHRVDLYGASARRDYLAAHSQVDMLLDTFPYPGGATTCEALWMGVPTVTLAGDTLLARQGASLLSAAGLRDWIAHDLEQYIEKAVGFASDTAGLSKLRAGLREKVLKSPLFDAKRFARNFEKALWKMWDDYSEGSSNPAKGARKRRSKE
jgi:protein O-GlcNAc transferase